MEGITKSVDLRTGLQEEKSSNEILNISKLLISYPTKYEQHSVF